ncbi:hypothetical protein JCM8208_004403 [Rhodotorula glutinis]
MSSRLPQELFDAVLDKLAEPPLDYHDYYTSKYALAKAARSSRCLHSVAQANLWRNIWLQDTSEDEFKAIEAAAAINELGSRTTTLVYSSGGWSTDDGPLCEAVDIVHVFPGIVDMHIICCLGHSRMTVSLTNLSTHTKLRHLSLIGLLLLDNVLSVNLPGLETLQIHDCSLLNWAAAVLLQPGTIPSVRVLSLIGNVDLDSTTAFDLKDVIAPSLLPQLDYAQVGVGVLDPDSDLAKGVVPPFLFLTADGLVSSLPRHSRPLYGCTLDVINIVHALSSVALDFYRSTAQAPHVVVLARTVLELAAEDERAAAAVRQLESSARAHAVRIMWVPEPPCWDSRTRWEGEFRAYGRELRLAREAAA